MNKRIHTRILKWLIFSFFFWQGNSFAQIKIDEPSVLTMEDGLAGNHVRDIVKDPHGFIWIATNSGVSRFDGSSFLNILQDVKDPESLQDGRVNSLLADSSRLWIGNHTGWSIYEFKTGKLTNYQMEDCVLRDSIIADGYTGIFSFYRTADGDIWMGTTNQGIIRYNPKEDTYICYRVNPEEVTQYFNSSRGADRIYEMMQDNQNDSIIWAGSRSGLLRINKYSHDLKWYCFPDDDFNVQSGQNVFLDLYQDDQGRLYSGAWSKGVRIVDPYNQNLTLLPLDDRNSAEAKTIVLSPTADIKRKNEREIWISSSMGMLSYDLKSQMTSSVKFNNWQKDQFYGITFLDEENRIWGKTSNGLNIFDPTLQQFTNYSFRDYNEVGAGFAFYLVSPSKIGDLAVVARDVDAVYHLDINTKKWLRVPIPKPFLNSNNHYQSHGVGVKSAEEWYLIDASQLCLYNLTERSFKEITIPESIHYNQMRIAYFDSNDNLWIGTRNSGLIKWSTTTNKWKQFKSEFEPEGLPYTVGLINRIYEDSKKNIWIRREEGYSLYLTEKDTILNFLPDMGSSKIIKYPRFFSEDLNGRVWVSSPDAKLGFALVDQPHKGLVAVYDVKKLFGIAQILYMRTDPQGNVWLVTPKQIYKFTPDKIKIEAYSYQYGIKDLEFNAFTFLPSGELVLGGRNSIWIADPKDLKPNPEQPKPYLTGISVLQKELKSELVPNHLPSLNLKYWENFFSFSFSSIGYTLGKKNRFRYRLNPFDQEWIDAGDRRFANYTNVPSGDYQFEVQVANNEEIWSEHQLSIPVHIGTAWYATTWFLGLLGLFMIALIYTIYRYRINQTVKEERIKANFEKRLMEVEMNALRAQMNPHFLFNCLNSIERYIIINDTKRASEYLNNFARLIRLILQNSRSNYIPLSDEIEALDLYLQMESMRFRGKFDYEIKVQNGLKPSNIDIPPMLFQPFVENAIWHGLMHKKDGESRCVLINLFRDNGHLIGQIEDNGIGRERAQIIKQQRATKGKKSVGMQITRDRIKMINQLYNFNTSLKIIDLKNEDGKAIGTKVEIKIPI